MFYSTLIHFILIQQEHSYNYIMAAEQLTVLYCAGFIFYTVKK